MRIVVVFPAPFGPRNPTIWPFWTSNEIWSTATVCAYRFVSPFTVIIRILFETDAYEIIMVPQPQFYVAKGNSRNLAGLMSILNIKEPISDRGAQAVALFIQTHGPHPRKAINHRDADLR
jgi:hypothetical protein